METENKIPTKVGGYNVKAYDYAVTHRGQLGVLTHYVEELCGYIDGAEVVIVCEAESGLWLITPDCHEDEERIADLGPYDTVEDAMIHFRLIVEMD